MTRKKKILIITSSLGVGGAEIVLGNIAMHLQYEFDIKIISLTGAVEAINAEKCRNIEIFALDLKKDFIKSIYQIIKVILFFQPNIIQGWMYHGNIVAAFGKLASPKSRLFFGIRQSLQDLNLQKRCTKMLILLCRLMSRFADKVIYNSNTGYHDHINFGYSKKNAIIIHNGYDGSKFKKSKGAKAKLCDELALDRESFLIGMISRFHHVKNHKLFVEAADILSAKYQGDVSFILAGDGPMLSDTKKLASANNNIYFLGRRSDVNFIASAIDIYVSCSLSEGMSNSIAESMLCQCIVVATNVGDATDMIGPNGVVIDGFDASSLAAAIEVVMLKPVTERDVLSQKSRQHIMRKYSMKKMLDRYKEVYNG